MGRSWVSFFVIASLACSAPAHAPMGSANEAALWPWREPVASFVTNMPESDETSIESVALAITAKEPDPVRRLKALHDWVATRLRYDRAHEAAPPSVTPLATFWEPDAARTPATAFSMQTYGPYPPAADLVFHSRIGVCGDYASLLSELGKYAGLDVKYVTGYARSWGASDQGYHAWNVAHVGDQYLMIDATWDSEPYSTEYLFVPPDIFAQSHLPDQREDLHTHIPINRATFDAHPVMSPSFFGAHLSFIGEVGNPMFTKGDARLTLDNPDQHTLVAYAFPSRRTTDWAYWVCTVTTADKTVVSCPLDSPGDYQIAIAPMSTTRESVNPPWAIVHVIEEK